MLDWLDGRDKLLNFSVSPWVDEIVNSPLEVNGHPSPHVSIPSKFLCFALATLFVMDAFELLRHVSCPTAPRLLFFILFNFSSQTIVVVLVHHFYYFESGCGSA